MRVVCILGDDEEASDGAIGTLLESMAWDDNNNALPRVEGAPARTVGPGAINCIIASPRGGGVAPGVPGPPLGSTTSTTTRSLGTFSSALRRTRISLGI